MDDFPVSSKYQGTATYEKVVDIETKVNTLPVTPIKSIQRGVANLQTETTLNIAISEVNLSKAVLNYLGLNTATTSVTAIHTLLNFLDSTTIQAVRITGTTYDNISWEVVEYV